MSKVCAVIVTFNPLPSLAENLSALQNQVDALVLVDNGTFPRWPAPLQAVVKKPGITFLPNPENLGVATAFNQGLRHALSQGYEWAVTFDQDSQPPPQFMAGLWEAWQACPLRDHVAVIAPQYWLKETAPPASPAGRPAWRPLRVAMASGNLVRLQAAQSVGWMDESFFIDYVDFDFCLRLRRQGWQIIQATNVWLPHRLGARQKHRCLGLEFGLVAHSPLRRYYNTRNRLVAYRRHALRFPGWFLHDLAWWMLEMGKIALFEDQKTAKCRAIWLGLHDGFSGVMGPVRSATASLLQPSEPPRGFNSSPCAHG
ncbi:glycosyltransferase family 2 protein [Fontisphaera persica]|uniref:glycosyltransferase family 2 protein n=1 Tax=Fontisphaera persica TaxID=2974023 RepID=UPI0024C0B426|nr:glycosyltransferase family 2 protein [Fontisphaera persica]WCJ58927.1 glycosyltransferase family 2 protein [Fontisphaera persica]